MATFLLTKNKYRTFYGVALFFVPLLLLGAAFVTVTDKAPYQAELAFTEISDNDSVLGAVIPASCESNPPSWTDATPCQCTISHSACSGPNCTKTVSVATSYNAFPFGSLRVFVDGTQVANFPGGSWSHSADIPVGGVEYEILRPDNLVLCRAFVPGPPAPSVTFTGTPLSVFPNQDVTLDWTVENANNCLATMGWSGNKPFNGSHQEVVRPSQTTTYRLTCSGVAGTVTRAQTITVLRPTITLTATPGLVGPGAASTLRWTPQGATSCIAGGGWTGVKSATNGPHTQVVNPDVTTTYSITCGNVSGSTTASAVVTVPSGTISATTCVIPTGGTGCTSRVTWSSANFLGLPQVLQGASQFSATAASTNVNRTVTPDNATFTLRDAGSSFAVTATSNAACALRSQWVGTLCLALPDIVVTAESGFVRPGSSTTINVEVTAAYGAQCNFIAGLSDTFVHTGTPATQTYSFPTGAISSEQTITLRCNSQAYNVVADSDSTVIEVVPLSQEI